nr:gliding motility-associated C-terminal domain-containing protein [Chitinophaga sp. MD30]
MGTTLTDLSTNGLNADPDGNGVPDEQVVTPLLLNPTRLRIPEGFSPNGDGINDRFIIANAGNDKIQLEVYNRWGNLVYKNVNYRNEWDGKCNTGIHIKEDIPDGTYYYIVTATGSTGTERYVNYITIIR